MYNKENFIYHLLDEKGVLIKQLNNIEGCRISYTSLSRLKSKMELTLYADVADQLNYNHQIRVIHNLNGIENPIGTFLISTSNEERSSKYKTVPVTGYSHLWFLDANKCTKRHYVPRGTNVINEITRLCNELFPNLVIVLPESLKATSVPREWEIGTPYLDIFNDLLDTINFTSLYPLSDGAIATRAYVVPFDRAIDHTYREDDAESKLEVMCKVELDYFDVPNIFVRYINTPDTLDMIARYENDSINSPTSTANRPPNVDALEVMDAADRQTLMDIAKRDCASATNKYSKIEFATAIKPNHSYMDCVHITLNGVSDKYIETSWEIDCQTGGQMIHQARKAVKV